MSETPTLNIAIAINKAYIPYAYVLLTSVACNHTQHIKVFVFHHDLSETDMDAFKPLTKNYDIEFQYLYIIILFFFNFYSFFIIDLHS